MIPTFPKFKKLEFSDKNEIESFSRKHPPYSDFNFVSMWSWNIKDEIQISTFNSNIVIKFTDYISGLPLYSFLGHSDVDITAEELLQLSEKEGIPPILKLIPEEVALKLNFDLFRIEEDRDHFDYVISIKRLLPHNGSERKLSSRRKLINKFKQDNNPELRIINIHQQHVQKEIFEVFSEWEAQLNIETEEISHLKLAISKLFEIPESKTIISFGLYLDNQLIGYSINEVIDNGYAVGHFQQANLKVFKGVYALLMQETAQYLDTLNFSFINIEQDLGIEGLKKWKQSYNPAFFLKKYTVTYKK